MRIVLRIFFACVLGLTIFDAQGATLVPDSNVPTAPQAQSAPPANVTAPARLPQRTETLRFDNWVVTCQEFADAPKKRTCVGELQAADNGNARILLILTLHINDSKQLVGDLQTPSGVMVAPGVELTLSSGEDMERSKQKAAVRKFIFESCEPNRCIATLNLDNSFVREATGASTATVVIRAINGNAVQFKFPVKGIDKAFEQLKANTD